MRTREGVVATALGTSWLAPAKQAEWGVMEAKRLTSMHQNSGVQGRVRLATLHIIADYVLIPNLSTLLSKYPGLELSIEPSAQIADMTRLEADLAIRLVRPESGELSVKRLANDNTGIVRPYATHELKQRVSRLSVDQWPWISWSQPRFVPPPQKALFESVGIVPRLTCASATTMIEAARHGLGVVFIAQGVARSLPDLTPMPAPPGWSFRGSLWLVGHQNMRNVPRINAVWEWIVTMMSATEALSSRSTAP